METVMSQKLGAAPATQPTQQPAKQRTSPKSLERLNIRDNHALCTFLLSYKFLPGGTFDDVAVDANIALGLKIINKSHIQHRMQEFNLKLVPGRPSENVRLELLEAAFREIAQKLLDNSPTTVMPATRAFLDSFGG